MREHVVDGGGVERRAEKFNLKPTPSVFFRKIRECQKTVKIPATRKDTSH